jgi:hypothetical protein
MPPTSSQRCPSTYSAPGQSVERCALLLGHSTRHESRDFVWSHAMADACPSTYSRLAGVSPERCGLDNGHAGRHESAHLAWLGTRTWPLTAGGHLAGGTEASIAEPVAYEPRVGDIVTIRELRVVPDFAGGMGDIELSAVKNLIPLDQVELVCRAEPDWQPGDIGQHAETGECFVYNPLAAGVWSWLCVTPGSRYLARRDSNLLAGKLTRMRLVPEGEVTS